MPERGLRRGGHTEIYTLKWGSLKGSVVVHEKAIRYDWMVASTTEGDCEAVGRRKASENVALALALLLRWLEGGEDRLVEHVLQAFLKRVEVSRGNLSKYCLSWGCGAA